MSAVDTSNIFSALLSKKKKRSTKQKPPPNPSPSTDPEDANDGQQSRRGGKLGEGGSNCVEYTQQSSRSSIVENGVDGDDVGKRRVKKESADLASSTCSDTTTGYNNNLSEFDNELWNSPGPTVSSWADCEEDDDDRDSQQQTTSMDSLKDVEEVSFSAYLE